VVILRSKPRPTSVRHAYFTRFTQYLWDIFSFLDGGEDELFELYVGVLFVDLIDSGTGKTHTGDILTDMEKGKLCPTFRKLRAADDSRMKCSRITKSFAFVNAEW
jgi:hypothetical protein